MILIVGLGNPGVKYQKTRHNVGVRVVDEFQKKNNFPKFKFLKTQHQSKARCWTSPAPKQSFWCGEFNALISEGIFGEEKVVLAKPQTFMNLSGKSIKSLTKNYKLQTTNLFIVHDDIDLPLGKIKIVKNRGAAGHRGVESIIKELKEKIFIRLRIGIQPKSGKPKNVEKFVLQKFNKEEEKVVKEVIKKTIEAIEGAIKEGVEKAMSFYNC